MTRQTEWNQNTSAADRMRSAARAGRLLRSGDLDVPSAVLSRLAHDGELVRVRRGVYIGADIEPHRLHEGAAVALRTPRAVLGLFTALEFHGLTTAWADGTWVLVPRDQNPPQDEGLHVVRVRPDLLGEGLGIETLEVHGVPVRITGPTRTVLDCWKYTRRVPHSVAVEALRTLRASDAWNGRTLFRLAGELGVWTKLRPFVEALHETTRASSRWSPHHQGHRRPPARQPRRTRCPARGHRGPPARS